VRRGIELPAAASCSCRSIRAATMGFPKQPASDVPEVSAATRAQFTAEAMHRLAGKIEKNAQA